MKNVCTILAVALSVTGVLAAPTEKRTACPDKSAASGYGKYASYGSYKNPKLPAKYSNYGDYSGATLPSKYSNYGTYKREPEADAAVEASE